MTEPKETTAPEVRESKELDTLLEGFEQKYGRIAVARSKGRAVAAFRPCTFEEWEPFVLPGCDEMVASKTLAQKCRLHPTEQELGAIQERYANFSYHVMQAIRRESGGFLTVKLDEPGEKVDVLDGDDVVMTFGLPTFVEVQRYTKTVQDRPSKRFVAQRAYLLSCARGARDAAEEKLARWPCVIAPTVTAVEVLAGGEFDFSGN